MPLRISQLRKHERHKKLPLLSALCVSAIKQSAVTAEKDKIGLSHKGKFCFLHTLCFIVSFITNTCSILSKQMSTQTLRERCQRVSGLPQPGALTIWGFSTLLKGTLAVPWRSPATRTLFNFRSSTGAWTESAQHTALETELPAPHHHTASLTGSVVDFGLLQQNQSLVPVLCPLHGCVTSQNWSWASISSSSSSG